MCCKCVVYTFIYMNMKTPNENNPFRIESDRKSESEKNGISISGQRTVIQRTDSNNVPMPMFQTKHTTCVSTTMPRHDLLSYKTITQCT